LDSEADGIERNCGDVVVENRERVSDVPENFSLLDVKAQSNLGVLQVVVARARVRLIGLEIKCRDN
jgi:hypothetical protein